MGKNEVKGVHPLFLCTFYNLNEYNQEDLTELGKSLEKVKVKAKALSGVFGDFNLPKLTWADNILTLKSDCSLKPAYDIFWT